MTFPRNEKITEAILSTMDQWREKFGQKNRNYGNSWLLTGKTLDLWFPAGLQVKGARQLIMFGLITRVLDKIIRVAHLELAGVADEVGEASAETWADLGVYGLMASGLVSKLRDS